MSQQAVVSLTPDEERTLRQWSRAGTGEQRLVERAKVILLLNQGVANVEIARQLRTRPARVSKWRRRFAERRLDGLRDGERKGRPSIYDQATEKRVLALLDEPPPEGYGKWSGPLVAQALGDVSDDQVWRVLRKYKCLLGAAPELVHQHGSRVRSEGGRYRGVVLESAAERAGSLRGREALHSSSGAGAGLVTAA